MINISDQFLLKLLDGRKKHAIRLPRQNDIHIFIKNLVEILFPHFISSSRKISTTMQISSITKTTNEIKAEFDHVENSLRRLLTFLSDKLSVSIEQTLEDFFSTLPDIYEKLLLDAEAIYKEDPAATSIDEVILAYPGFYAIVVYRIAHQLYEQGVPTIPRVLTEYAHSKTGIDIHPGAQIGSSFCIDHGTGIVIGETTIIGNHVKLYQGVTLGAFSINKNMANSKRHPTIEDNVVIYAQATVLGGDTVIGENSIIGGNAWITESVPANSKIYRNKE